MLRLHAKSQRKFASGRQTFDLIMSGIYSQERQQERIYQVALALTDGLARC